MNTSKNCRSKLLRLPDGSLIRYEMLVALTFNQMEGLASLSWKFRSETEGSYSDGHWTKPMSVEEFSRWSEFFSGKEETAPIP